MSGFAQFTPASRRLSRPAASVLLAALLGVQLAGTCVPARAQSVAVAAAPSARPAPTFDDRKPGSANDDTCARYGPGESPPFSGCSDASIVAAAPPAPVLPASKRARVGLYLSAEEAHRLVVAAGGRVLFVDVRTRPEVAFLGMALPVDANVPFQHVSAFQTWSDKPGDLDLEPNLAFVDQIEARLAATGLAKADPVILICRSGTRSARAADRLAGRGFTRVYSVVTRATSPSRATTRAGVSSTAGATPACPGPTGSSATGSPTIDS